MISEALHQQREAAALSLADSRPDGFSRQEGAEAMRCNVKQAGYHIRILVNKGKLARVRGGADSRYCRPERAVAVTMYLDEQDYAKATAIRQVLIPASQTRVEIPRGAVASIFDLGTRLAA